LRVILLASNSPRRKELLSLGNLPFEILVSNTDESLQSGESPAQYVLRLAEAKAWAVSGKARAEHVIIGSDTSVVMDGDILGKPADQEEARSMLKRLQNRSHEVYTAIAVLRVSDQKLITDLCITSVPMRDYSDAEIDAYVNTGDPLDKAGAYAIQHAQFKPVASMSGCYASVMGLPLCHVMKTLRQFDIHFDASLPHNCQTLLKYDCPVSESILK
jgi:MAF protein